MVSLFQKAAVKLVESVGVFYAETIGTYVQRLAGGSVVVNGKVCCNNLLGICNERYD